MIVKETMDKEPVMRKYRCGSCNRLHFSTSNLSGSKDKSCNASPSGQFLEVKRA